MVAFLVFLLAVLFLADAALLNAARYLRRQEPHTLRNSNRATNLDLIRCGCIAAITLTMTALVITLIA